MRTYRLAPLILQALLWPFARLILLIFAKFEVRGLENLKEVKNPVIFASNHISEIDPLLVRASIPMFSRFAPLFYVSRKNYIDSINGLRKYIYGGVFFKAWGAYPTESGHKDYAVSVQNHFKLLREGNSLCIFPEGRISSDGNVGETHGGAGFLAWEAAVPVIPVHIDGMYKKTSGEFFSGKCKIIITIGKPLLPSDLFKEDFNHTPENFRTVSRRMLG